MHVKQALCRDGWLNDFGLVDLVWRGFLSLLYVEHIEVGLSKLLPDTFVLLWSGRIEEVDAEVKCALDFVFGELLAHIGQIGRAHV